MHLLVCLMLVSGSLAHYHYYDVRDIVERDELPADSDGVYVSCPTCLPMHDDTFLPNIEQCIEVNGQSVKKCRHGTYKNPQCGGRWDCFRTIGERCTENSYGKAYLERCGAGLQCNKHFGKCMGLDTMVNPLQQNYIDSNTHYTGNLLDRHSAFDPKYPLRQRRQA